MGFPFERSSETPSRLKGIETLGRGAIIHIAPVSFRNAFPVEGNRNYRAELLLVGDFVSDVQKRLPG